ncbi:hypothetical protein BCR36DRAFT_466901, partial [Piromyces finnis]
LTHEKLIWIHLYETIIDRLNYEDRELIHVNEIPNFNHIFKMLNDIHSTSSHQPRLQNDDQQVATLEEDRPTTPLITDPFLIDNFEEFDDHEYDRLIIDINRDVLLNDLENYDNSLITTIDRVQPHLVIFNLPERQKNILSFDITNFHKLSYMNCRFIYTYYYYYRMNFCGLCKKVFPYPLTGIKVWTIRLCSFCAFKNIISRKPWLCSINYNLDNDKKYKNKYYGFRLKNDKVENIKKYIILEFYFKPQVDLLINEKHNNTYKKENFERSINDYKNKLIQITKNLKKTNDETKRRREYELNKLIQSNIPNLQQKFDLTNLPYKLYSCIQFYLTKGTNSICYCPHTHPMEFMCLSDENAIEYEIRNSYLNLFEDYQYLKLIDILKMVKIHYQNTEIWNTIFRTLKYTYHISFEECQNCFLFHFWIMEFQKISYLLSKNEIHQYIDESIHNIVKIKETEEKINESIRVSWNKNINFLIEKKFYKKCNATNYEKFRNDAKKKFLKDNKNRFDDIPFLIVEAKNMGEDYINCLKYYVYKKEKLPKLNSLVYQNYINEKIDKLPIKIKNEIYNNIMNENGDKELKEIYYDYIYDKKSNCVNHSSICLDAAINDLQIRYKIISEEKKLNNELKFWFGENFIGYDSLQTEVSKKAYKDYIFTTSISNEYTEFDKKHFHILGYMLYKIELLNDILQRLLPNFNIDDMSDECLEIYNNYIGNYDSYLGKLDNENYICEKNYFIFCMNDYNHCQEYITLSSYMQYPYSQLSFITNDNINKSHFECFHEYLILNEFEEEELNKTLDSILKLESIKNQRYFIIIIKNTY